MKQSFIKKGLSVVAITMVLAFAGCTSTAATTQAASTAATTTSTATTKTTGTTVTSSANAVIDTTDLFSTRDMEQTADTSNATKITVTSGQDVEITSEGIYVISGTATDVTIKVEAPEDAKVQIVLDGVSITNTDAPCIYVKTADKVFVTTTSTENTLKVTGTFTTDGDINTDAVIFSKSDLTLNGTGTLNISSTDNGITSKDDLKITGGTYNITSTGQSLQANDSIAIADGTFNITSSKDGIHAENNEDDTVGYVYIAGGDFTIKATKQGIQATTICEIDGGTFNITAMEGIEATDIEIDGGNITISASDDGMNASAKSTAESVQIVINDGTLNVTVGSGDTDAIDANGSITVNGGTINITAPTSSFDYDTTGTINGGTVTVNGTQVTTMPAQMMGGGRGGMQTNQTSGATTSTTKGF
jgi:hypothetical protein